MLITVPHNYVLKLKDTFNLLASVWLEEPMYIWEISYRFKSECQSTEIVADWISLVLSVFLSASWVENAPITFYITLFPQFYQNWDFFPFTSLGLFIFFISIKGSVPQNIIILKFFIYERPQNIFTLLCSDNIKEEVTKTKLPNALESITYKLGFCRSQMSFLPIFKRA